MDTYMAARIALRGSLLATLVAGLIGVTAASAQSPSARAEGKSTPAAQKVGDHHEVRIVAVKAATEWSLFPGMPGMPTVKPNAGETLLLVEFAAKDLRTGKDDPDASFSGFEVEDAAGKKTRSPIEKTDVREIPFGVADPAAVRVFRLGGASFDVQALTKGLVKP